MADLNKMTGSPKAPSSKEAVKGMLDQVDQQQAQTDISTNMGAVKEGVSELLAGAEKPSEGVSERKGESGEKGDVKASSAQGSDAGATAHAVPLKQYTFPSDIVMVHKIRSAINDQIKEEWKNAKRLQKNMLKGGASDYNASIARIRHLKEALSTLFSATMDFLKQAYVKYFHPNGKRRDLSEIEA
ncbi:hypothetical protein IPJ72_01725 [Candidatus Peregrinibacteria bacterium]|nr:MAG: hypothetical protein IPJ72_01725 [Candidatus Peregrinibacteria bacterium]